MEVLGRVLLHENLDTDPEYVYGPVACAVLYGGSGFVAASQIFPVSGPGTRHRIWKISTSYEVTGYLDILVDPENFSAPMLVGVADGRAFFANAGSWDVVSSTGSDKSYILDCTGDAPVIESTGINQMIFDDKAIYGDSFQQNEIRYSAETKKVYILCNGVNGLSIDSLFQVFDATNGDKLGSRFTLDVFEQYGMVMDPNRPYMIKCFTEPRPLVPTVFPNFNDVESENVTNPNADAAIGITELNTLDIDDTGRIAVYSYEDLLGEFWWIQAVTSPYRPYPYWMDNSDDDVLPDKSTYQLNTYDLFDNEQVSTTTDTILDAIFVNDCRLTRPVGTYVLHWAFSTPDENNILELRELVNDEDGTPLVNSETLDWSDLGDPAEARGWNAGSGGLSHDPSTGLMICGFGILWGSALEGETSSAVAWIVSTSPDPEFFPLRLKQRNDGRGVAGHARLGLSNSAKHSTAPRIGGGHTYV